MRLGFVSAILPELNLDRVLAFADAEQFTCVEIMCWPFGRAERKFAGVTHIDVTGLTAAQADGIHALCSAISQHRRVLRRFSRCAAILAAALPKRAAFWTPRVFARATPLRPRWPRTGWVAALPCCAKHGVPVSA